MSRRSRMTFRDLIEREYLSKGANKLQAWTVIYMATGVSFASSRAAYDGTRVLPETAKQLYHWALRHHAVEIDADALLNAPTAKLRKKKERAEQTV